MPSQWSPPPYMPFQQPIQWNANAQNSVSYPLQSPQWNTANHLAFYPQPTPLSEPMQPSILSQFKGTNGTYDINKMMNTMGQMVNTFNQISGVFKGFMK